MSVAAVDWALRQVQVGAVPRLLLVYMANRHNPERGVVASQNELARDLGLCRSQINSHLQTLEEAGLVKRETASSGGKRGRPVTRFILTAAPDFAAPGAGMPARPAAATEAEARLAALVPSGFVDDLRAALRFPPDAEPSGWWVHPAGLAQIGAWFEAGATAEMILQVAGASRKGAREAPPDGPLAICRDVRRALARASGAARRSAPRRDLARPAPPPGLSAEDATALRAAPYVRWIKAGSDLAARMKPEDARYLIRTGQVTAEECRACGVTW